MIEDFNKDPAGRPTRRMIFEAARDSEIISGCLQLLETKNFTIEEVLIATVLIYQQRYKELNDQLKPVEVVTTTEKNRIIALLDKEVEYLEDGDYWKTDDFLRISAKTLRLFRDQVTGENQG